MLFGLLAFESLKLSIIIHTFDVIEQTLFSIHISSYVLIRFIYFIQINVLFEENIL